MGNGRGGGCFFSVHVSIKLIVANSEAEENTDFVLCSYVNRVNARNKNVNAIVLMVTI